MSKHHWPYWALSSLVVALRLAARGHFLLLLSLVAALASLGLAVPRLRSLTLVIALALALGALRSLDPQGSDPWRDLDGLRLDATGLVVGQVRSRERSLTFHLRIERLEGRPELQAQTVQVVWHAPRERHPQPLSGERWRLSGRLSAPRGPDYPGGFDSAGWLKSRGIFHEVHGWENRDGLQRLRPPGGWGVRSWAWYLRARLLEGLRGGLSPRQHALLCGIVLGETQFLAPADEESFRATGTSHLLAASGLNVALVVALVTGLGSWLGFGPSRTALPALAMAGCYALLADAGPSLLRATVMAGVSLTALAVGRISGVLHGLALTGLLCLGAQPAYLEDLGFQLSVLAVLSLVLFEPACAARLAGLPAWLRRTLSSTLACSLGLLPWMAWHFQQWAPATVLANALMTPVAELLLPLGLLQGLLHLIHPALSVPLAGLNSALLEYLLNCGSHLAAWFGPGLIARPDPAQLLGLILAVTGIGLWLHGLLDYRLMLLADALLALLWRPRPGGPGLQLFLAASGLLWVHLPSGVEVVLAPRDRLDAGLRMARIQGVWPHLLWALEEPHRAQGRGLRLEQRPNSCRLHYRQGRILVAWEEPPATHRAPVDLLIAPRRWVECRLWVAPGRALQIACQGHAIRVGPWQDNRNAWGTRADAPLRTATGHPLGGPPRQP